jgi:pSer/pThr/pTyr-binding forkhead associated (FHA) protein
MSGLILLGLRILAVIALYAFLGWALYLLWHSLKEEAVFLASRKVKPITLVINSPDEDEYLRSFTQNDVVIGRDPECECDLKQQSVSARHARLTYHHGQWWLDDLNSKNGTRLNDELLQTPTVVVNGDKIKCADTVLMIVFEPALSQNTGDLP